MSCAYLTDLDIEKIIRAAIKLDEDGTQPSPKVIADIADGDEDIPELIRNMAKCRGLLWTSRAGGIHILELERELDLEDMEDKHDPTMAAILAIRCAGYDLEFTETPGTFKLYEDVPQEGASYQVEGRRYYRLLSYADILIMQQDLKEGE